MRRWTVAGASALWLAFSAGTALGQGTSEPEPVGAEGEADATSPDAASPGLTSSKEQFVEARKLFDEGRFEAALPQLKEVFEATGSPNAQLYVARALREMGRLVEAHRAMAKALDVATTKAAEDSKYEVTRIAAAGELATLDTRVGKVVVVFADKVEGTSISLNGTPLTDAELGAPVAVEPGTVIIVATTPGKPDIRQEEVLSAGQTRTVALRFGQTGPTEPGQTPQTPDAPTETSGGGIRIAGFVALGVGVVGMGMFGVSYAVAGGIESDLEEACGGQRCTESEFADDVDRGKTMDTLANVGLVVGAVGLVSGAAMVLFGGPTEGSDSGATVAAGPDGAMAAWRTTF